MDESTIRILTWNVAWARPDSEKGKKIHKIISDVDPDLVCLTESHCDFFSHGYTVSSDPDYGYPIKENRRKVLIWSKKPWHHVDTVGHEQMPKGRFISAKTIISGKTLHMIGVCVPWRAAHVNTGLKDKCPWQDHIQYFQGLKSVFSQEELCHTVLAGDFNQTFPRTTQPEKVFELMLDATKEFSGFVKSSKESGRVIDHIAVTRDMSLGPVKIIFSENDGHILSDHSGLYADCVFE